MQDVSNQIMENTKMEWSTPKIFSLSMKDTNGGPAFSNSEETQVHGPNSSGS